MGSEAVTKAVLGGAPAFEGTTALRQPTVPLETAAPTVVEPAGRNTLRKKLISFDVISFLAGWSVAIFTPLAALGPTASTVEGQLLQLSIVTAASLGAMAVHRLYLARVCSVRSDELSRTARSSATGALILMVISQLLQHPFSLPRAVLGAALAFLIAGMFRGIYGSMLRERRARGLHRRPIVIIGTNAEARELAHLVATHPEFGYEPVGVIGRKSEYDDWISEEIPFIGTADRASDLVAAAQANGVLIAASALDPVELKRVTRDLLATDLHVHISSGLWGIDHRRLRSVPLAHEPLFYVERVSLSRFNTTLKRSVDVVASSIALIILAPIIAIAALAVKLYDRGPVFFKQTRVGKDGEEFAVLKLRTMVPNAESLLPELRAKANLREGPLFKMERDPRQTKVGRILEAASLDELPQLFNVLQGTMSLVGPRPALPAEAAQFDEELQERFSVPPGITGLWQVEARDNPSFSAYRRLDLFYVENWSLTLDIAILIETATAVLGRLIRGLRRSKD